MRWKIFQALSQLKILVLSFFETDLSLVMLFSSSFTFLLQFS